MTMPWRVTQLRDELEKHNWRVAPEDGRKLTRSHKHWMEKEGKILPKDSPIFFEGKQITKGHLRIVCGQHGPYVEFNEEQLECDLVIPKDQEWRQLPKYNVKYLHMCPTHSPQLKVYNQLKTVSYADYLKGMFYVDYWLVNSKK